MTPLRDWAAPDSASTSEAPTAASGLFGPVLELVGSLPGDGVAVVTSSVGQVVTVANTSHYIHLDQPAIVVEQIQNLAR